MKKEEFYIYQEELIRYKFSHDKLSISKMVVELNKQFCSAGMKKLRIETITNYLVKQGFLFLNELFNIMDRNPLEHQNKKQRI